MNIRIFTGLLFAFLLSQSCSRVEKVESVEELNSFISDPANGLLKESIVNDYRFKVQYRPTDFMVAQEMDFGTNANEYSAEELKNLREKYVAYTYFVLDLSSAGGNVLYSAAGGGNFSDLLHKLAFRLNEYASLRSSSGRELRLVDFIYPRLYGASKSAAVLLVFEKVNPQEDAWVKFHLKEFGLGVGTLEFEFQTKDLAQSPCLQFNK